MSWDLVSSTEFSYETNLIPYTGAKECVESAKARIEEIVNDLDQQVSMDCVIHQKHHRTIMGSKGSRVQDITKEFDVKIKFPEKSTNVAVEVTEPGEKATDHVNGDAAQVAVDEAPKPCDIIRITGVKTKLICF